MKRAVANPQPPVEIPGARPATLRARYFIKALSQYWQKRHCGFGMEHRFSACRDVGLMNIPLSGQAVGTKALSITGYKSPIGRSAGEITR